MEITTVTCPAGQPFSTVGYVAQDCPGVGCTLGRVMTSVASSGTEYISLRIEALGQLVGTDALSTKSLCDHNWSPRNGILGGMSGPSSAFIQPDECTPKNGTNFDSTRPEGFTDVSRAQKIQEFAGSWFADKLPNSWDYPRTVLWEAPEQSVYMRVDCKSPQEKNGVVELNCMGNVGSVVWSDGTVPPLTMRTGLTGRGATFKEALEQVDKFFKSNVWDYSLERQSV